MWEIFQAGGPVMWPLLACSVASLTVILERVCFWVRLDLERDKEAIEALLEAFRTRDKELAPKNKGRGAVFRMLATGMAHEGFSSTRAMETVALETIKNMRRGMPILDTIITIAPMLGILGTVMGIITSFDMLGQAGVNDPKIVVSGIAEALITTAAGLAISVGTVFPFNYFSSRIEDAQDLFEHYATRLEILLECSPPAGQNRKS